MTRFAAFVLLGIHAAAQTAAPTPAADVVLSSQTIERTLADGGRHQYRLDLSAGEFAAIAVEQRGIDVTVHLLDHERRTVAEFQNDWTPAGAERVTVVADSAHPVVLAVVPGERHRPSGAYAIRVTERRTATAADRDVRDAIALRYEVGLLLEAQKLKEALPLATRAVALAERGAASGSLEVGLAHRALAEVSASLRSYAEAESAYNRAVAVFEPVLGRAAPLTALATARLAHVYRRLGQPLVAERLLRAAIAALEAALGPDHLAVASALINLGTVRQDAGDAVEAEALARRALAIAEKRGAPDHFRAPILNNLGVIAMERRRLDEADAFLRQALELGERLYGHDTYSMANTMLNLGIVARQRKQYDQAEAYYLKALAIREKLVPPDHPDIASNLNNLATLYSSRGNLAQSLAMHQRVLAIWEKVGGPYSSGRLMSLGNIARTYAASGDAANALVYQRRADAALETQLTLQLAIGSERQRLAFAARVAERTDRTISLSLGLAAHDPGASALAALVLLQRKGRVLDAMIDTVSSFRQRAGAADAALLTELGETTRNLARVALNGREEMTPQEHRSAIAALEQKKEQIEAAISDHNAEFRARALPVTLDAIQAAIPRDAKLVEYTVFRPFDPGAPTNAEAYGPPRYAAYVIAREGMPRGFDLGDAAAIDAAIEKLRAALRDPRRRDVASLSRALHARVLTPIVPAIGTSSRLLISPDGPLNLVPFEALAGRDGRYAIHRYAITYLTSGRDLLRMAVASPSRSAAVIVADPAFGAPDAAASRYFAPLSGTAREAEQVRTALQQATVLTQHAASKAALARLAAPRALHIATHGFFLADAKIDNPLLRSGLALAGANGGTGAGGGLMTALEAANLDLWGTKLVTLSACDTGLGTVRNGEGVYGMRRAFVLAGAETLVMSLWPVSDYVTRQMMAGYYRGLKMGLGRGESLRKVQLALQADPRRRHPYYWASFIQAGDWTPLKGS